MFKKPTLLDDGNEVITFVEPQVHRMRLEWKELNINIARF